MFANASPNARWKRRWLQFRLRTMLVAVAVFAFLLGMVVQFWPHFWWRFGWTRAFRDVQRIPTAPMSVAETPEDWVRCRFGRLELELPVCLAEGLQKRREAHSMIALKDDERQILLSLPDGPAAVASYVQAAAGDDPELRRLTPARLRLAMYQAS
ncbi:MAG TPA: hypothetical protein VMY37_06695 [Thermoguttaceae bacterium]|nr:hypothetical protein [Thermoguttaceae bacterium]